VVALIFHGSFPAIERAANTIDTTLNQSVATDKAA
jgi:hypothetical protein